MQSVGENFGQTVEAGPTVVGPLRTRLADFARRAGASPDEVEAVRLAVSEALTNAVIHAYSGEAGPIEVRACARENELTIVIRDEGRGVEPRAVRPGLGLGLALIARLSEDLQVRARSAGGTEVRIRFALAGAQRSGLTRASQSEIRGGGAPASPGPTVASWLAA